jgi:predicted lipid-binding transport protein (Tim44 family)
MRYFLSFIMILSVCTSLIFIGEAQAKRFGGGRSFGMQRSISSNYARVQPSPSMQSNRFGSPASKWGSRLAGLAMGGMLAYLLMGHGFGSGILSWLMIAGAIYLLLNLLRQRTQTATQTPYYEHVAQDNPSPFQSRYTPANGRFGATYDSPSYPAGFDADAFIRDCKVQFIRLQAAYDQKNLNDLREFTTPEVFAEIQLQFQDRGNVDNHTIVEKLDAELLEVTTEFQIDVASVRFSGLIQEDANMLAQPFNETWHFRADKANSRWFVAGIQQN